MEEIWRPLSEYPGYEASNLGEIRSWKKSGAGRGPRETPRVLNTDQLDKYRYVKVSIGHANTGVPVHRLIASAFLGPALGRQVDHINRVRHDNRVCNLRYVTARENQQNCTRRTGERNHKSVVSDAQRVAIGRLANCGAYTHRVIAESYGLKRITVSAIAKRYRLGTS